jgi:hypothetical protein
MRDQTVTERTSKFLGSKYIKQDEIHSDDSCPKAEHQEQRGYRREEDQKKTD